MSAILHIRKNVLGVSQAEMARIAGTTQATVSRWETGELSPDLNQLEVIRTAARSARPDWDDSWFFEGPPPANDCHAQP